MEWLAIETAPSHGLFLVGRYLPNKEWDWDLMCLDMDDCEPLSVHLESMEHAWSHWAIPSPPQWGGARGTALTDDKRRENAGRD